MPKRIDDPNRVFCDGNVVLKKRKGSSYWQAHMKVRGKWIRESTGTTVLRDAKEWAIEQHGKMMYRVQHRQVPRTKLVRDACDQYRMDLDANPIASINEYKTIMRKWIEPYFGGTKLDEITPQSLVAWNKWKAEQHGKAFSKSTLTSHNACLSNVLNTAVQYGWLNGWQVPKMVNKGEKGQRRPDFEEYEITPLLVKMHQSIAEGRKERTRDIRQLLFYYVQVLLLTGVRPGKELDSLEWKNVDLDWETQGQKFVKIKITAGKTTKTSPVRYRAVTAPANVAAPVFKKIKAWQNAGKGPGDEEHQFVFRLPDGSKIGNIQHSFETVLTNIGMLWSKPRKEDSAIPDGSAEKPQRRSLYSIRHSYATAQIIHNTMSLIELSTHMGTSVAMLDRHYAHLGPLAIAPKIAANAMLFVPHITAEIFNTEQPHEEAVSPIAVPDSLADHLRNIGKK